MRVSDEQLREIAELRCAAGPTAVAMAKELLAARAALEASRVELMSTNRAWTYREQRLRTALHELLCACTNEEGFEGAKAQ